MFELQYVFIWDQKSLGHLSQTKKCVNVIALDQTKQLWNTVKIHSQARLLGLKWKFDPKGFLAVEYVTQLLSSNILKYW